MKNTIVKVSILSTTFLLGVFAFAFLYLQRPLPQISEPENLPVEEVFNCKKPKNFPGLSQEISLLKKDKSGYFPEKIFSDGWDTNYSLSNWYGKFLKAMEEKSLLDIKDENREIYRFLWLRSFHHPIFVRVERNKHNFNLISREFDGAGGYEPGKPSRTDKFSLSKDEWCEFMNLVEKANFWKIETIQSNGGHDGARWILEGVKDNRYHVVDRWSPEIGKYREACIYLLKLSGRDIDELKSDLY